MEELKILIGCFLAFTAGLLLAIKLGQALYD
uniref:Photosystem I protein M n=1 Tax=Pinus tabuliformis TaxID=88731 RepID=A0A0S1YCX6_PINTB|nr:photosystem I protein M [Pinus tabuliformis]WCL27488.1 photosystem I protein M [Pinus tabuliformis var. henryi]ALM88167.1 photosystem I protein M [Pinus tabuliformis]WCL27784.1 photosystem I protein M [Pinus tabuliformis var. henryi]WCL28006.1 photosystem I protein M [Pinus tabuliformis var. henryi]WCL28080.1 photosystem I protein M [Pinus tabuliformis var. henryi]